MKVMYHCLPYNREFIDVRMAKEHIEYTWPRDYAAETLKADREYLVRLWKLMCHTLTLPINLLLARAIEKFIR
jgi:hypothetical protein